MPLYRYECLNCMTSFEKIVSLKDRYENSVEIECPKCGSIENKILISRSNFSLKGSGWYKDGYQSEKSKS